MPYVLMKIPPKVLECVKEQPTTWGIYQAQMPRVIHLQQVTIVLRLLLVNLVKNQWLVHGVSRKQRANWIIKIHAEAQMIMLGT